MYTFYICRTLNVMMYVYALKDCELERVLNITYNSFAISVMLSFNRMFLFFFIDQQSLLFSDVQQCLK